MASSRGVARLGMLAVGLGVGAAVAHAPVASADSSSDWLSSIDSFLGGGAVPAPATGLNLDISFDGYTLVHEGTAYADTTSGDYSLAIADGDNAEALAFGTGGSAYADGSDAYAYSAGGTGDVAAADGTNAFAEAGGESGDTGADGDTALDIGNNDLPLSIAEPRDGAYAGNADLDGGGSETGSDDTAIDIGNNTNDGSDSGYDGSFAGAGGLLGDPGDGNNDTAIDVGNNSGEFDGSDAINGNGNYASESGSTTGYDENAFAGYGNDNTAVADTSYTTANYGAHADHGNDNYASVLGPENSYVDAEEGDSNVAYVLDPFGSTADNAYAGFGNSSDLAAVLFTDGTAGADSANNLYDILTAFGLESGTF
jgi:hypothetical protein